MPLSKEDGWARALLVRRSIEEKPEFAYYLCYAPSGKDTIETLVRVAGERWKIEQAFETAKGECGLDHYEVRHWQGWYRHITLSMLAHAVLTALRARGEKNSRRASAAQRARTAPSAHRVAIARVARPCTPAALVRVAKTTSIPRHVLPLSKARIDSADLLSTTVVLKHFRIYCRLGCPILSALFCGKGGKPTKFGSTQFRKML